MSKKGLQKGPSLQSVKKEATTGADKYPWEKDIEHFDVTIDLDFKCYVAFFMESSSEFYGLLELFNEEATDGRRWEIKVITLDLIRNTVLDNCTKSRQKKPFNLLCDQILRYAGFDFKKKIPPNLLGYFIKYEIRRLKTMYKEYLDYQKECEEHKLEKQKIISSTEKTPNEEEPKVNGSIKISEQKMTPVSKIKPFKPQALSLYGKRRAESELTRRGEEAREKTYVKDSPIHGPQVYLIISLVYQQLPAELIEKLGVPVTCIIRVGNDQQLNSWKESNNKTVYKKLLEINEEYYKSKCYKTKFNLPLAENNKKKEIRKFWLDFNKKIQQPGNSRYYERTILGQYIPPLDNLDFNSIKWKIELKTQIYDDITKTLYNLHKIITLYNKYNSSENININLPEEATGEYSSDIYNEILNRIPAKCINVPIIFDAILTQVDNPHVFPTSVATLTEIDVLSEIPKENRKYLLDEKIYKMNNLHDIHRDFESDLVKQKSTLINDILNKDVEIKYIYDKKCFKIFKKAAQVPYAFFEGQFKSIELSDNLKEEYKSNFATFRKALGIQENKLFSEILLVLKTKESNYKKLKLESITNRKSFEEEDTEVIIENFSHNKAGSVETIFTLNTFEQLSSNMLTKKWFELYLSHNTSERIYIPLLNSILYTFYNRQINKARTVAMQTPLGLKDFFKYILHKENEWSTEVTNIKLDESSLNTAITKVGVLEIPEPILSPQEITPKLTIDEHTFTMDADTVIDNETNEVIRYLEETEFPDTFVTLSKTTKGQSMPKIEESQERTGSYSSLRKDSSDPTESSQKQPKEVYDFGQAQRVQFSSRNIEAIFRYGTKVKIQYRHKHYGEKTMNLEIEMCGHRLYYTSNVHINSEKSKILLVHKGGIIFSFKERKKEKILISNSQRKKESTCPSKLVTYYNATICTPSEYAIEFKFLEEENVYIKHSLLENSTAKKIENEQYRIFLANNSIVKFMTDGTYEILYSCGKKIVCNTNERRSDELESEPCYLRLENYDIFYGCGKVCSFKNGEKLNEEKKMLYQETMCYSDNFKLIEHKNGTTIQINYDGSQIVKFNDGTRFITEIICVEETLPASSDISLLENSYVNIYLKISCEHENLATTIYDELNKTVKIKLPEIEIVLFSNKTYSVYMNKCLVLEVKEEVIILDKFLNNALFQRSHILPNVLKYNYISKPPLTHFLTRDIYGNELKIDTQSQIYYKYSFLKENSFILKYAVSNKKHVLLRRDLSGFEIIPNHIWTLFKTKSEKQRKILMQNEWNMPFINSIILFPRERKHNDKNNKAMLPSTYGKTIYFPFFLSERYIVKNTQKSNKYEFQVLKTFVCDNLRKKYEDTVEKRKSLIKQEIKIVNCKCVASKPKVPKPLKFILKGHELHRKENILVKNPNLEFIRYLKDVILNSALKKADEKISKSEITNKFNIKRNEILQRKIPPFFESAFGISYFIINEIENILKTFIEKKEETKF